MYIDSGDSLAAKTGSRKLIKKRSTFCPISKSASSLDYEFLVRGFKVFDLYPGINEYMNHFEERYAQLLASINQIFRQDYSLETFAQQYEQFGVIAVNDTYTYKEYAPNALEIYLTGDFNQWNHKQYPLVNDGNGVWTLILPEGVKIPHQSKIAAYVRTSKDQYVLRVPIGARYIAKLEEQNTFCEIFWNPSEKYTFRNYHPHKPRVFKIYRSEITKCGPEQRPYTYNEYAETELARIKSLGYNTVLLVGVQEHKVSGGSYSVINPYAINSTAGNPDDLKRLVDKAHEIGLYVTMDIVQTHASTEEGGFNGWDGSHFSYFIDGEQGLHPSGGRLFNFAKWETQRLLLSNLGYFMNEYKIDGFRFIDVPAILYKHHGQYTFKGVLSDYFNENISLDGLVYLMLANETVHKINSNAVTFAEDETNFPSLCLPLDQGGIGFDYRVSIKAADSLALLLSQDDVVDTQKLAQLFQSRLSDEKIVASLCYKSSDIILQDVRETIHQTQDALVLRKLALHKLARMIILTLGGDSYLNRYGNEFGTSSEYLRTDLMVQTPYKELMEFDKAVLNLEETYQILSMKEKSLTQKDGGLLIFERGDLIFVFNLSTIEQAGLKIGTKWNCNHRIIFSTDDGVFGGQSQVPHTVVTVIPELVSNVLVRPFHLVLQIPSFTGIVLQPFDTEGMQEERKEQ